ncbi:LacI family DNA-binding transcriptional regulator [Actinoplanes sp. LDG1-06]|uniref:LacI family DNA-binding transcriptional regulator n=1 Tax=Paractinoplanes ovalisporus TaxID=2810368 RepID=A0ABS2AQC7_9ACTN|nr:LacI family DNA-binding transcriptional regulator [Actinoplanes ovalisporus]MBM2622025.1 LacI family DNA-binding transcriptional regulator [Actinoplanes ovalisporus]
MKRPPYRIREIAAQAGLSEATVDRVLHGRGGVRASTVREVHHAIDDLDRQRDQVRLGGRTFLVDVVVQAPPRFAATIRAAMEAELPALRPAVFRARFHEGDVVPALGRISRSGSHGVILKAPDLPEVVAATRGLGVPLVTLVTDLPASPRIAYVGIDNRAAGATTAYLIDQWLGDRPGDVLVVRGEGSFRGEDDRAAGFRAENRRPVVEVVDDRNTVPAIRAALREHPGIRAIYSLYAGAGGNTAVVEAFEGHPYEVFIAHDLDGENTMLLRERKPSAVLHHDLRTDLRRACHAVLQAHGVVPGPVRTNPSAVQVITPYNAPPVEF